MGRFSAVDWLDRTSLGRVIAPWLSAGLRAQRRRGSDIDAPAAPPHEPVRMPRTWSGRLLHAPGTLRALVRTDDLWFTAMATVMGLISGLGVTAMSLITQYMHQVLFGLNAKERLSSQIEIRSALLVAVPILGGLLLGVLGIAIARWSPRRAVDPIEANALYGGRMSLNDSLIVVGQTMLSNGVGASVGLEAGYTQLCSAIASRFGRSFRLRRNDLRLLVGCGAAGAIAAAFNAPLTGAFYAFELVIGTYTLATLAPVVASSVVAVSITRLLIPDEFTNFNVRLPTAIEPVNYLPILAMSIICALIAILIMRGVTFTETIFRRSKVPVWARPALGGLVVGLLALLSPQVLSSGHAALHEDFDAPFSPWLLLTLIVLKSVASAVSLGSGFRGGLFFASLFLGALVGKLFTALLAMVTVVQALPSVVSAIVGMAAMAVAIVGGPLTMTFLALESTGSLPMTVAVLAASVLSAITVRRIFGYSFATWRFHLRGEAIRSAVDIGWVRSLTVGRMMRRQVTTLPSDMSLVAFLRSVPLGTTDRIVMADPGGRYAGIVLVPEAHAADAKTAKLADLLHYHNDTLLPQMNVKEAITRFDTAEADALVVVDGPETRRVIGLLTEQHALRRYSEELDRQRRDLSGE